MLSRRHKSNLNPFTLDLIEAILISSLTDFEKDVIVNTQRL